MERRLWTLCEHKQSAYDLYVRLKSLWKQGTLETDVAWKQDPFPEHHH